MPSGATTGKSDSIGTYDSATLDAQMWSLAISQGLKIQAMSQWISPYPTLSEINKRAALRYYAGKAGSPMVRKLVAIMRKLG
jgi:hypothetical protein